MSDEKKDVVEAAKELAGDVKDTAVNTVENVSDAVAGLADKAKDAVGSATEKLGDGAEAIGDAGKAAVGAAVGAVGGLAAGLTGGLGNLVDKAKDVAGDTKDAASSVVGKVGDVAEGAADKVGDAGKAALEVAAGVAGAAVGKAGDAVEAVGDAGKAAVGGAVDAGKAAVGAAGAAVDKVGDLAEGAVSGAPKWLVPGLIALALIGGALYMMKGCGPAPQVGEASVSAPESTTTPAPEASPDTAASPAAEATPAPEASPAASEVALTDVKLPDGTVLKGAAEGIESQLVGFIQDAAKPVDKTTWFNFDRLNFDTGKATLQPSSKAQLENIAAILKAFPNVSLKIGGYTDNTGNKDANLKLSGDRATTVVTELTTLGVDKARLESEGYGDQHPVGDNATEEGRAKNRRIAVRVTKK